jgi:methionine sulfoxide reductase heme-binding subunit
MQTKSRTYIAGSICAGISDVTTAQATRGPGVRRFDPYPWLKPGVVVGALVPLAVLVGDAVRGELGADPVAIALNRLGLLALILLLACLTATPLRLLFGVSWPLRIRRLLGLLAFFYASLHFLVYAWVDQGWAWSDIATDVAKRPFITVGFFALLALVPLAVTSNARARRKLGPRRWQLLHRLVYVAAALAALHFFWRVKRDVTEPLVYGGVLGVLLWIRLRASLAKRGSARARGSSERYD